MSKHQYTEKEIQWLEDYAPGKTIGDICRNFNSCFHTVISPKVLASTCRYHHIPYAKAQTEENTHHYTEAEIKWLRTAVSSYISLQDLTEKFNSRFSASVTKSGILSTCSKNSISLSDARFAALKRKYEGMTKKMSCGLNATVIRYNGEKDTLVRFEDGVEKHTKMSLFLSGRVLHPSYTRSEIRHKTIQEKFRKEHLGETAVMKCGMKASITDITDSKHLTVTFADGTVRDNISYRSFKSGEVRNPNSPNAAVRIQLGQISTNRAGIRFMVTGKQTNSKTGKPLYSVLFEDGTATENITTAAINSCSLMHPMFDYKRMSSHDFHGWTLTGQAFKTNTSIYYYCVSPDGKPDVLTPQQILQKEEIQPAF